jgi:hypothetical protein
MKLSTLILKNTYEFCNLISFSNSQKINLDEVVYSTGQKFYTYKTTGILKFLPDF